MRWRVWCSWRHWRSSGWGSPSRTEPLGARARPGRRAGPSRPRACGPRAGRAGARGAGARRARARRARAAAASRSGRAGAARRRAPRARRGRRRRRPPARSRRGAATARAGALRRWDLRRGHGLRELRNQPLEEAGHALLLAPDALGELGRVLIAYRGGERLDRRVRGDLLGLVLELGLGVLQELLLLAGTTRDVQWPSRQRRRLVGRGLERVRRRHHAVATGLAAELLDAPLDVARVRLRLLEMRLEPLLVRRPRGHRDVRLECGLQLLLLAISLVEVLHELGVALV